MRSWHNARSVSRIRTIARIVLLLAIAPLFSVGCARPYAGPKTLAALGVGLLAAGGTTWAVGARGNHGNVAPAGMLTTAIGAAAVFAAGGWLAISVACTEDPDCPRTEECREIPTAPGGYPYRQCMPRQGP
jgi:hypothetical protein